MIRVPFSVAATTHCQGNKDSSSSNDSSNDTRRIHKNLLAAIETYTSDHSRRRIRRPLSATTTAQLSSSPSAHFAANRQHQQHQQHQHHIAFKRHSFNIGSTAGSSDIFSNTVGHGNQTARRLSWTPEYGINIQPTLPLLSLKKKAPTNKATERRGRSKSFSRANSRNSSSSLSPAVNMFNGGGGNNRSNSTCFLPQRKSLRSKMQRAHSEQNVTANIQNANSSSNRNNGRSRSNSLNNNNNYSHTSSSSMNKSQSSSNNKRRETNWNNHSTRSARSTRSNTSNPNDMLDDDDDDSMPSDHSDHPSNKQQRRFYNDDDDADSYESQDDDYQKSHHPSNNNNSNNKQLLARANVNASMLRTLSCEVELFGSSEHAMMAANHHDDDSSATSSSSEHDDDISSVWQASEKGSDCCGYSKGDEEEQNNADGPNSYFKKPNYDRDDDDDDDESYYLEQDKKYHHQHCSSSNDSSSSSSSMDSFGADDLDDDEIASQRTARQQNHRHLNSNNRTDTNQLSSFLEEENNASQESRYNRMSDGDDDDDDENESIGFSVSIMSMASIATAVTPFAIREGDDEDGYRGCNYSGNGGTDRPIRSSTAAAAPLLLSTHDAYLNLLDEHDILVMNHEDAMIILERRKAEKNRLTKVLTIQEEEYAQRQERLETLQVRREKLEFDMLEQRSAAAIRFKPQQAMLSDHHDLTRRQKVAWDSLDEAVQLLEAQRQERKELVGALAVRPETTDEEVREELDRNRRRKKCEQLQARLATMEQEVEKLRGRKKALDAVVFPELIGQEIFVNEDSNRSGMEDEDGGTTITSATLHSSDTLS